MAAHARGVGGVVAMKLFPETWTRETWSRAAVSTLPGLDIGDQHMTSPATTHHADYVGQGMWTVDWLPGRQFDARAAKTAMFIAIAPGWPEVERWAPVLGLTSVEARGLVAGVA
jgi:hypothetical protein